jgi:hypothetical protein
MVHIYLAPSAQSASSLDLPTGQIIDARPTAGGIASANGLGGSLPAGGLLSSVRSRRAAHSYFPDTPPGSKLPTELPGNKKGSDFIAAS